MNIRTRKDRLIHFQSMEVQRKKKGHKDTFRNLGFYTIFTEEMVRNKRILTDNPMVY